MMLGNVDSRKNILKLIQAEGFEPLMKRWLIPIDSQTAIPLFIKDLGRNFGLAAHRVSGDQTSRNLDDF